MNRRNCLTTTFFLALLYASAAMAQTTDTTQDELDAYWLEVARTVSEGDFEAYVQGYHPDAIYVSSSEEVSQPIAKAFAAWKQGFLDTQQGKSQPTVEFRFSRRLHDATSAHETGIFRYSSGAESEGAEPVYVHFEALLVKKDRWLTLMEYQKSAATRAEWDSL